MFDRKFTELHGGHRVVMINCSPLSAFTMLCDPPQRLWFVYDDKSIYRVAQKSKPLSRIIIKLY